MKKEIVKLENIIKNKDSRIKEHLKTIKDLQCNVENLNHDRLVKLQKYVRSCFKTAGDSIPARYLDEFKRNKMENQDERDNIIEQEINLESLNEKDVDLDQEQNQEIIQNELTQSNEIQNNDDNKENNNEKNEMVPNESGAINMGGEEEGENEDDEINLDDLTEEQKIALLQQREILQQLQEEAEAKGEHFDVQEYLEMLEKQANEEEEEEPDNNNNDREKEEKVNKSF